MSAWFYKETERYTDEDGCARVLYTVGIEDSAGNWHGDSDHSDREEAAARCAFLNGEMRGNPFETTPEEEAKLEEARRASTREYRRYQIAKAVLAGYAASGQLMIEAELSAVTRADTLLDVLEGIR